MIMEWFSAHSHKPYVAADSRDSSLTVLRGKEGLKTGKIRQTPYEIGFVCHSNFFSCCATVQHVSRNT